ncbi:hypothetical protein CSB37_04295 [bacterium DOLZORAL124_38_8]|nr:MAG: hypothetical protein CSB37_04295 [bacterium DOLZORAL124_38_8]
MTKFHSNIKNLGSKKDPSNRYLFARICSFAFRTREYSQKTETKKMKKSHKLLNHMKKIILILFLVIGTGLVLSSCSEEDSTPTPSIETQGEISWESNGKTFTVKPEKIDINFNGSKEPVKVDVFAYQAETEFKILFGSPGFVPEEAIKIENKNNSENGGTALHFVVTIDPKELLADEYEGFIPFVFKYFETSPTQELQIKIKK